MAGSSSHSRSPTTIPRTYGRQRAGKYSKKKRKLEEESGQEEATTKLGETSSNKRPKRDKSTFSSLSQSQINQQANAEIYLRGRSKSDEDLESANSSSCRTQNKHLNLGQIAKIDSDIKATANLKSDIQPSIKPHRQSILCYFKPRPALPSIQQHTPPFSSLNLDSQLSCFSDVRHTPPSSLPLESNSLIQQSRLAPKKSKRRLTTNPELPAIMSPNTRKNSGFSGEDSGILKSDEVVSKTGIDAAEELDVEDSVNQGQIQQGQSSLQVGVDGPATSRARAKNYIQTTLVSEKNVFTYCGTCDLLYNTTNQEDVKNHNKFHRKHVVPRSAQSDPFVLQMSWKDDKRQKHRVFGVSADSGSWWQEDAQKFVLESYESLSGPKIDELDLFTYVNDPVSGYRIPRYKIYYHLIDDEFAALVVAEYIRKAGEFYDGPVTFDQYGDASDESMQKTQEWVSLDNSFEVKVCIDRLAVIPRLRRQGLAKELVDLVLETFADRVLTKPEMAFSRLTADGTKFAQKYCEGGLWSVTNQYGRKKNLPYLINPEDARSIIVDGRLVERENIPSNRWARR